MLGVVVDVKGEHAAERTLAATGGGYAIGERQAVKELQGRVDRYGDAVGNLRARLLGQQESGLLRALRGCGELRINVMQQSLQPGEPHLHIIKRFSSSDTPLRLKPSGFCTVTDPDVFS
jgi:hypothetical protein